MGRSRSCRGGDAPRESRAVAGRLFVVPPFFQILFFKGALLGDPSCARCGCVLTEAEEAGGSLPRHLANEAPRPSPPDVMGSGPCGLYFMGSNPGRLMEAADLFTFD